MLSERGKPRIFLGSSGKQAKLLAALTRGLEDVASVEPWTTSFHPGTTIKLAVKVVPSAARNGIAGWLGESLKVRVTAAPERGQANAAVEAVIAAALGLPRERARVVAGHTSPRKVVEIDGLSEAEVHRRLAKDSA